MILTPAELAQIRRGKKTQHRIPIRRHRHTLDPGTGHTINPPIRPTIYTAGRNYIAQARPGGPGFRIELLDIHRALLDDMTDQDARHEGHPDLHAFATAWRQRHHLKPPAQGGRSIWPRPVWVLTFKTLDERTVWLAQPTIQDDYTFRADQATIDAGPVTDPTATMLLEARQREALEYARQRNAPIHERVATTLATAQANGVDTHRYEAKIERELEALAARTRRHAA